MIIAQNDILIKKLDSHQTERDFFKCHKNQLRSTLFDIRRKNPILFSIGDTIKFIKINSKEFKSLYKKNLKEPININSEKRKRKE